MPKVADTPAPLRPYLFHGLDLYWRAGDTEALGDCPWCGREGKFSVNIETGLWRCFVCAEGTENGGGNPRLFLEMLHKASYDSTAAHAYRELAENRSLVNFDTLVQWGACQSILGRVWLLSVYSLDGTTLKSLYRYVRGTERMLLLPTPGQGAHLFGLNLYSPAKPTVFLCEGPWDAMALWETLGMAKESEEGLVLTANPSASLLGSANVLGVPGCETFHESWLPLFAGKVVNLMYDSDHPRKHPQTGKRIDPAGYSAMRRVAGLLSRAPEPPSEIHYLMWGPEGYAADKPSGYDVRDLLSQK